MFDRHLLTPFQEEEIKQTGEHNNEFKACNKLKISILFNYWTWKHCIPSPHKPLPHSFLVQKVLQVLKRMKSNQLFKPYMQNLSPTSEYPDPTEPVAPIFLSDSSLKITPTNVAHPCLFVSFLPIPINTNLTSTQILSQMNQKSPNTQKYSFKRGENGEKK